MSDGVTLLRAEIAEQPRVWRALAARGEELAELAARLAGAAPPLVRIAGHGTSDHAAIYASYVLRIALGWTVTRDSISLPLYYDAPAARAGELAIGISQSGETPDVVAWLRAARADGATTLALTNDGSSSLAAAADHVLALGAGVERSVAATKTYTGTLAAFALLAGHGAGRGAETSAALEAAADAAEAALPDLTEAVEPVAAELADAQRMYLSARGLELATAYEVALKLTEVSYLGAKAMSATSMAHGPVAALDATLPLWLVAAPDATLAAVQEAARRALAAGAPVIASGAAADELEGATHRLPAPRAQEPLLSPLLSVLPGQLFAVALALAKGLDPGAPRNIRKVTSAA
jgi:glucosamine--fructose-6-phosphate aminotransferase (isomerizing)